jgi:hypothetical protein
VTDERQVLNLIGQLYEAAANPFAFAELPAVLAPHFRSDSTFLHTCTPRLLRMPAVLAATRNFDSAACSAYVDHYHDVNIWFERGTKKPIGTIVFGEELVSEAELLASEWYDYCRSTNAHHLLGATMHLDDKTFGAGGIPRPRGSNPFDEADRRRLAAIAPHLQRALRQPGRRAHPEVWPGSYGLARAAEASGSKARPGS